MESIDEKITKREQIGLKKFAIEKAILFNAHGVAFSEHCLNLSKEIYNWIISNDSDIIKDNTSE